MTSHGAKQTAHQSRCNSTVDLHAPLPTRAVQTAQMLIGAVHEQGPDDVAAILQPLSRPQLLELVVALAAMVPVDYTPTELLAWNDARYQVRRTEVADHQPPLFPVVLVNGRPLRPHGTHAAFVRHRSHREEPCAACWHGEREYQRGRKRRYRQGEVAS